MSKAFATTSAARSRAGHRCFKIKIGGAGLDADAQRIEAVLAVLEPGMRLAVDGNGTFDRATALRYVEALSAYPLAWLEEPVHPLDFELHREVAGRSGLPLATGENLFSADDARNLLRYGGLRNDRDMLQFDISLSYGVVEYLRILDELAEQGWSRAAVRAACRAPVGDECGRRPRPRPGRNRDGHHDIVRRDHRRHRDQRRAREPARMRPAPASKRPPVFQQVFGGLLN